MRWATRLLSLERHEMCRLCKFFFFLCLSQTFSFHVLFQQNLARDECHELKEDVKGLMARCGRLSGLLLAVGGNPSLPYVNPYVRVPLPSSVRSQSQSWASTQMMRGPRQVQPRLEGEASSRTAGVEEDSASKK
ncbi:hypothetical protein AMTR_s00080p00183750 [Amborella trichopoda]|uniref:Uncharacterized protein n=1 Tax=Amborella trichopoda TaxID=13333 RepID=W1PAL5_AMBTC|nr:hypothetical protein AMTR_s00080p00183750 [Amborella trichopoda]